MSCTNCRCQYSGTVSATYTEGGSYPLTAPKPREDQLPEFVALSERYQALLDAHTKVQQDSNVTLERYRKYKAFFDLFDSLRKDGGLLLYIFSTEVRKKFYRLRQECLDNNPR